MSEELNETTSSAEQTEVQKDSETSNVKAQIEEKLDTKIDKKEDVNKIPEEFKTKLNNLQQLLNSGFISQQQGQNLLKHIIGTTLNGNTQKMLENKTTETFDNTSAFNEFEKENPKFFNQNGRKEILDYLKTSVLQFDKDELSKISKIVEQVEKSAIEDYVRKVAHEKNLEQSNSVAKQKLQANAQNLKSDGKNYSTFTREQIGKMTSAEFLKNEALIMEQLKKGLIK